LLRRADGPGIELLLGDVEDVEDLADLPLPAVKRGNAGPQLLALVPYRQVVERDFPCHDDGTPLRCLVVREHVVLSDDDVLSAIPDQAVNVTGEGFDVDDDTYAEIVGTVIRDEIGRGEGANFVIRRDYRAHLDDSPPHAALRLFRRLLSSEPNAYWTFAIHAGDVTMVGATPERHVSVTGGTVVMNPISGTYRYPADGATEHGILRFLADPKETEELFMVVDEELKMMSAVCEHGGQVLGPFLKEMGHLAHTEYLLEGRSTLDVRDVLRETMFAPTVTGSPVKNAARVITRYERSGRGYYAGVAALIGQDDAGRRTMDAPILIRTAYISPMGQVRVPVGATLVRHSVSSSEVAETHAKAAGVLGALWLGAGARRPTRIARGELADHPGVAEALALRNATLAPFWLRDQSGHALDQNGHPLDQDGHRRDQLAGRTAMIVDAEDSWTTMLAHLLRRLGMTADVVPWTAYDDSDPRQRGRDLLISGPGPGDPRDSGDPRIRRLRQLMTMRLAERRPLLAVCLSHQILADLQGFPVTPLAQPYQGTQREIDFYGRRTSAGFYNTFTARIPSGSRTPPSGVQIAADAATAEVHALRGPGFASVQFHLESILTTHGIDMLADLVGDLFAPAPAAL
jgi:phenazine biosynthesis protein phzE